MAGAVGVPLMGKLADGYLAESLPAAETTAVLERVTQAFPAYITRAQETSDLAALGYREREVQEALTASEGGLAAAAQAGGVHGDATANALRAIVATAIPEEPLVGEANAILQPAEAQGGQRSFRYVAPAALILVLVFGLMFLRDRRQGGYRAVRLEQAALVLLALTGLAGTAAAQARPAAALPSDDRMRVLFLGDNGHHRPTQRAKEILPVLAANGIDLFYTEDRADLNAAELRRYHAVVLYNNHLTVAPDQLNALLAFVREGKGLVVLHCASASFQNSEEFIRLVGGAFKSHGTGTFRTVHVAP
jgi:hypothetical protein